MPPETKEKADKPEKGPALPPAPKVPDAANAPTGDETGVVGPDREDQEVQEDRDDERDDHGKKSGKVVKEKVDYVAPTAKAVPAGPGFFTIYKKGQGYWTRMGTALGAMLLGLLTAWNLYYYLPAVIGITRGAAATVAGVFLAGFAALVWWLTNKPSNVDFLIATDSEMRKVNWTSRRELIGSTKVVIVFMLIIAMTLFVIDVFFGMIMYAIGVLRASPFQSVGGG